MDVTIFATFVPKPGAAGAMEALLRGMVAPTRAEPGNRRYDLFRSGRATPQFHMMECFTDQAALDAHLATGHYQAFRASITDHLAEPVGVRQLAGVDVA